MSESNQIARSKASKEEKFLSVGDLTRLLNDVFELHVKYVAFQGEISQFQFAQSGHLYFTVKDEKAQISCVMWAGAARGLSFKPGQGTVVQCEGKPSLYGPSGRFQIVVHRMIPAGEGELQKKFLELKAKLEREGLFSPDRKRALPFFPRAIGIVTSKTGAVIHDMMVKIRERMPNVSVYLVDTRVQGPGSADEIAEAIDYLSDSKLIDVMIVARGGGSLEDLWSFNEEVVVRAIFRSSVPVISGVGHEVDVTLADFAADARAPTPTAAAEMVVPRRSDLLLTLSDYERRLQSVLSQVQVASQRVDELQLRLDSRMRGVLEEMRLGVKAANARLLQIKPAHVIELLQARVSALEGRVKQSLAPVFFEVRKNIVSSQAERLLISQTRYLKNCTTAISNLATRLDAIKPQRILDRGYAIVRLGERVVSSRKELREGASVSINLKDGVVSADVRKL